MYRYSGPDRRHKFLVEITPVEIQGAKGNESRSLTTH